MSGVEILIVEDSPEDLEIMLHSLKKHNFVNNIHVAEDGAMAVDYLLNETTPLGKLSDLRVVFLDLKLPKMNGIEVLEAIRKNERTKALPVVVLTSSQEEPDLRRCYELGVNSYIVKPVQFEQFTKVIAELGLYWLILNKVPS